MLRGAISCGFCVFLGFFLNELNEKRDKRGREFECFKQLIDILSCVKIRILHGMKQEEEGKYQKFDIDAGGKARHRSEMVFTFDAALRKEDLW